MEEELKQSFLSFNVFCNSKYCLGQSSHMYVKSDIWLMLTHIDVGVVGALHQSLSPFLELPPDDQIKVGEDDEGSHRGEDDPGPGGVPQDVVLA